MRIFMDEEDSLDSPFLTDILAFSYHIYSRESAKIPGCYPDEFPEYPEVALGDVRVGDYVTVRAFFRIGDEEPVQVDGGYIDLEVEQVEADHVVCAIRTELPEQFVLKTGELLEIREDEILSKVDVQIH